MKLIGGYLKNLVISGFITAIMVGLFNVSPIIPILILYLALVNRHELIYLMGYYSEKRVVKIGNYMMSNQRVERYKRSSEDDETIEELNNRLQQVNAPDLIWGSHYE